MTVELDPATRRITGHETVKVTNRTGKTLPSLYFHVYPNAFHHQKDGTYMQEIRAFEQPDLHLMQWREGSWLDVASISDRGTRLRFSVSRELLEVTLARPLAPSETRELELDFVTQLGPVAERSGTWDGNFSVGQWFPKLMVHDAGGWALEHNRGYHFVGEFYGDFGSYDVAITVPAAMKVGATGHKTEEHALPDGARKTLRFRADNVHDFAWVADSAYEETVEKAGGTTIHVLSRHPEYKAMAKYAREAIEYYGRRVGPYPYEDFTVGETLYNGTMEYPQLIFVRSFPPALARELETSLTRLLELYVVHETAHQWFYGAVGNNEVMNAWLDEGFSTFLEEAILRDRYAGRDNIVDFTSLLSLSDRQLGDAYWRFDAPDVTQPVQTPSYLFQDPNHYYSTVYYKVALFFRYFESLIGADQLNSIFHEYWHRNRFRNAEPHDWYDVVEHEAGREWAERWRDWINSADLRSDFSVSGLSSERGADGRFHHRFTVRQERSFFGPVDVELVDRTGKKQRLRAQPTAARPAVPLEAVTDAPLKSLEADPDHVAPDEDRFNNKPGVLPDVEVLLVTTPTVRDDALTLLPLPYASKNPGLGWEAGVLLGGLHYLDWGGYATVAQDLSRHVLDHSVFAGTIAPMSKWGWTLEEEKNVLVDHGGLLASRDLGPAAGHDPRNVVRAGVEHFGNLGDNVTGWGLGTEYALTNINNGRALRYSLTLHNSLARNLGGAGNADRLSGVARVIIPLAYRTHLDFRGIIGRAFGNPAVSQLFDLQAPQEGGMRFDYQDVGAFKVDTIRAANLELQLPIPYGTWVDKLLFIHGPTWTWHLFTDVSNAPGGGKVLNDAGAGTRIDVATGAYGRFTLNLEFVPYQNAVAPTGWGTPVVFFGLSDHVY